MSSLEEQGVSRFDSCTYQLNRLERLIAGHAYPPKLLLFTIGIMWALHFMWERLWLQAAVSFLIFLSLAIFAARGINKATLSKTLLGQVFVQMAQPLSFLIQIVAFTSLLFGAAVRGPFYVLIGASLILLAHANAWNRIMKRELRKTESVK